MKVYPRVCGGTGWNFSKMPHYRGDRGGSIPACAGEPGWASPPQVLQPVYPRVCGGTPPPDRLRGDQQGLSPRVRGNRARPIAECVYTGSIPACAGEPPGASPMDTLRSVYPRVCGGTGVYRAVGNASRRSIPACAGEPACGRVYPRVCGGSWSVSHGHPAIGLSPRVRGNRRIPRRGQCYPSRVYPRVCGGTGSADRSDRRWWGLSPRVRGNRSAGRCPHIRRGSMRVPRPDPRQRAIEWVYPRVCGGT